MFDREKYLNYKKYLTTEKMNFKSGSEILGNVTGGLIGKSSAQRAMKRQQREAERQAQAAAEEYRRQAQEEAKRRAEERARAEAEAKKRAEDEARRIAEEKARQRAENHYRDQLRADSQAIEKGNNQAQVSVGKPQTMVDFSKSLKLGEDEEDKLKKLFKMGR